MKPELDAALEYASMGLSVLPCHPGTKKPRLNDWTNEASTDPHVLAGWFKDTHNNIAVNCNNLVVLDVDTKNGKKGFETLETLTKEYGPFNTRTIFTPHGGFHIYFQLPDCFKIKNNEIMEGIDIRTQGGCVIAPPSKIDGVPYTLKNGAEIAPLPPMLADHLLELNATKKASAIQVEGGFKLGNRNNETFRLACSLRAKGLPIDDARAVIEKRAKECQPPLPTNEALTCLTSAYKYDETFELNDLGNVNRLRILYKDNLIYIPELGSWFNLENGTWHEGTKALIQSSVEGIRDLILLETRNAEAKEFQQPLVRHLKLSGNRKDIENTIKLAEGDSDFLRSTHKIDKSPDLLGVMNGVVDLNSGQLTQPEEIITKRCGVVYDSSATAPDWDTFLLEIFNGDIELIQYMQRVAGYTISGFTNEQCIFLLYGNGANGKSVLLYVLSHILGDYSKTTSPDTFMTTQANTHALADLHGARMVIAPEIDEQSKMDEALIKRITGGEKITARHLYQSYFEFDPQCAIWMMGNYLPAISGIDNGIWRRLHVIPFNQTYLPEDQNSNLSLQLTAQSSGILNWILEGFQEWKKQGLNPPKIILNEVSNYRAELDPVQTWLLDACKQSDNKVSLASAYTAFSTWYDEGTPMTKRKFSKTIKAKGYKISKSNSTSWVIGIELINEKISSQVPKVTIIK